MTTADDTASQPKTLSRRGPQPAPPPRRDRQSPSPPPVLAKKRRTDGRSRGKKTSDWSTPAGDDGYNARAEAQASNADSLGQSSKGKHKTMISDYERFSWSRKPAVDPKVLAADTDAHVANFYLYRLRQFELFESTARAISAAMTIYFAELGCSGPWQTGQDADKRATFSGNPNRSQAVERSRKTTSRLLRPRATSVCPSNLWRLGTRLPTLSSTLLSTRPSTRNACPTYASRI